MEPSYQKLPPSPPILGTDDRATTFAILKCIMGAGGFALPWAFERTGIVCGWAAAALCALLCSQTMAELVAVKSWVEIRRGTVGATYVDLAREVFGGPGAAAVYFLSIFCSLGVTSAYLVFIGATLHSLAPALAPPAWRLLAACLVLPFTWLRDFSGLARLAEYGTYAVLAGYVVTLDYAYRTERPGPLAPLPPVSWRSLARGFGPLSFMFCVHLVLFPVISASQAFNRPFGFEVLTLLAFSIAFLVNAGFGAAVLLFHRDVSSIVVDDISDGTLTVVATKLLLCVGIFSSYPLVLAAGRQIVENSLVPEELAGAGKTESKWLPDRRRAIRTVLVVLTLLMAELHHFGTIISLVGGFANVLLAFVLPPMMALRLLSKQMTGLRYMTNLVVLPLGCAIATLVTSTTLDDALTGH